jgi:hypothetical protein
MDTWRKRGHSPECWRTHAECALKSAKDICDTRAAQDKTRATIMGQAIQRLLLDKQSSPDAVFLARRILIEYHERMRIPGRESRR